MMRVIASLLIILGIVIMLYPTWNNVYSHYKQQRLLQAYESQLTTFLNEEADIVPHAVIAKDETKATHAQVAESYSELNRLFEQAEISENDAQEVASSTTDPNIVGTLQVDKIDLKLPVLDGATEKNLRYAAGHLEGTSGPGVEGNMTIAAHNSFSFGKLFNRLDELEYGDEVLITTNEGVYTYEVKDKLIVEPSDVSVLAVIEDQVMLTLITCHPLNNPTHRLIVHAHAKL